MKLYSRKLCTCKLVITCTHIDMFSKELKLCIYKLVFYEELKLCITYTLLFSEELMMGLFIYLSISNHKSTRTQHAEPAYLQIAQVPC